MAKSLCHLLMKVSHVIVANFYVAKMYFNATREFENFRNYSKNFDLNILKLNKTVQCQNIATSEGQKLVASYYDI